MFEDSQLKRIILEHLQLHTTSDGDAPVNMLDLNNYLRSVVELPSNESKRADIIVGALHDLYHERLITTGTANLAQGSQETFGWPRVRITKYGREVLKNPTTTPFDPDGYLAGLTSLVPKVDGTIVRYMQESLQCFKTSCLLGSAVMLGGASEKTVLLVIEAYAAALNPLDGAAFSAACDKRLSITHKVNTFWKQLEDPKTRNLLPSAAKENLSIAFEHIFNLIRAQRNAAGHPQIGEVERSVLLASFYLFPSYCQKAYALIEYFEENAGKLSLAITPP